MSVPRFQDNRDLENFNRQEFTSFFPRFPLKLDPVRFEKFYGDLFQGGVAKAITLIGDSQPVQGVFEAATSSVWRRIEFIARGSIRK